MAKNINNVSSSDVSMFEIVIYLDKNTLRLSRR